MSPTNELLLSGKRKLQIRCGRQLIPLGREQTPEDIAHAVHYLATAPNVTGVSLNVAGGMEVW